MTDERYAMFLVFATVLLLLSWGMSLRREWALAQLFAILAGAGFAAPLVIKYGALLLGGS